MKRANIAAIAIKDIQLHEPADAAIYEQIVSLGNRMVELQEKLAATKNPNTRAQIQALFDAAHKQMNKLVYRLYDLSHDEIAIVEHGSKSGQPVPGNPGAA